MDAKLIHNINIEKFASWAAGACYYFILYIRVR